MPQSTPKLGLVCYDLVNDGGVYFSVFRNTLAGYTNSALTKIDDFALRIDNDVTQLKLNPPIVRVSAIKTDDFLYEVTGVTEITEYRNNVYINLSLDFTNIGTVSLNINNLGVKGVYKIGNDGLIANLNAGDLKQNKMNLFRYNGTYWVWVNAVTSDQLNVVGTAGNLTKISTNNTLEDAGVTFATTATNNTIAQRTSTGQIKVATPVATEDASTKGYTDAVDNKIGVLTNLTTTDKTNVVNAVNEIDGKNYMYGDPVSEFENFDPINAQFLEGNPASYFSTKAYADTKAPIASPTFTGAPSSVTPATGDNTTKIATTAFVNAEITNDRPYATTTTTLVNGGTGVVGTSVNVARADHTHTMPQSVLQSQVINDLTTGGIANVLSAQQGVELDSAIGQITTRGYTNSAIATDCNLAIQNGKYITSNGVNAPSAGTFILDVTTENTASISQLAMSTFGVSAGKAFTRYRLSGVWSAWKELATTESYIPTLLNGWTGGAVIAKSGNIVAIELDLSNGVVSPLTVLLNVPEGFRPKTIRYSSITGTGGGNYIIQVNTNGDLTINNGATAWTTAQKVGSICFSII